jgi:hypothetical protein
VGLFDFLRQFVTVVFIDAAPAGSEGYKLQSYAAGQRSEFVDENRSDSVFDIHWSLHIRGEEGYRLAQSQVPSDNAYTRRYRFKTSLCYGRLLCCFIQFCLILIVLEPIGS